MVRKTGPGDSTSAELERYQLYYVVLALWVFQLIVSPLWLGRYRFGPLEWCWRSLTCWRRQPMRLDPPAPEFRPFGIADRSASPF